MVSQCGFFYPKSPQPKPRLGSLFCVDSFLLWINTKSAQHTMQLASRAVFATWPWPAGVSSFTPGQECASTFSANFLLAQAFRKVFTTGTCHFFLGGFSFRWFKRCYVQSLWTLWIGQTQWPVPSGPTRFSRTGEPPLGTWDTTFDGRTPYEDRCGTRGWKIIFMFLAYAYLHRLLICIDSISIHIAHCFFFQINTLHLLYSDTL